MKIYRKFLSLKQIIIGTWLLGALVLTVPDSLAQRTQKPPEIKAIEEKMSRGENLSAAEQKALDDYMKSLVDRMNEIMKKGSEAVKKSLDPSKPLKLDEDEYLPQFDASAHYNTAPVPPQSEYLEIVRNYNVKSGETLAEMKTKLDQSFAQMKTATEISNFGMMSLAGGKKDANNSAAAIFAVTTAALKTPNDALTASNFGVLLKNAGAYDDSLKVLLYAEKPAPQNALIQINLGWTIAYLGDFFTAKMHFQSAINLDKFNYQGYEGLGLLYRVEGNAQEASKYLRMCLKQGYSRSAAKNLREVENKYDVLITQSADDSTDPESVPGMRLSEIYEFPYPAPQGADDKLVFPDPPDFYSGSVKKVFDAHNKALFVEYGRQMDESLRRKNERLKSLEATLDPISPAPVYDGDTVIYPRSYEAEAYALMDMETVFMRRHLLRFVKFTRKMNTEVTGQARNKYYNLFNQFMREGTECNRDQDCEVAARRRFCLAKMNTLLTFNPGFQGIWQKYLKEEREDLRRYYKLAAPWLAEIGDKKLNEYLNLRREIAIQITDPVESNSIWQEWEGIVDADYSADCGSEPTPADTKNSLGRNLKVFPEPYGTCHVPTWKLTAGIAILSFTSEATCDSVKLEFSAFGVYSGLDRKFGEKESDDVTTLHIGFGEKAALPVPGTVNLVGKLGVYVSGRNGQMSDYGVEGVAKAERVSDLPGEMFNKTELAKFSEIKISGSSGPRDDGSSPINFTSVLDKLDK